MRCDDRLAIVRGGGDLATGIIYRLWRAGYKVLSLEVEKPLVVRRTVSAAEAIFEGSWNVDGMSVKRIDSLDEFPYASSDVAIIVDSLGSSIKELRPALVVDAIMAKRNTGTDIDMAPLVIGIGPGFTAGIDVDYVVETKRGHYLGRLICEGGAIPNTGIPGMEMGYTTERLLRAPADGFVIPIRHIGDHVLPGDAVAYISDSNIEIRSQIKGVLRGLIHPSVPVTKGLKIGDVDPRDIQAHCFSITDKALAIAGGVLEAILHNAATGVDSERSGDGNGSKNIKLYC